MNSSGDLTVTGTGDGTLETGTDFGTGSPFLIIVFACVAVASAAVVMNRKRKR